jgi:hypothetical protein
MTHPNIHALSDKQVEVLGRALDIAWHRVLQTNILDAPNMAEAQRILVQRIFDSTAEGECDPWKLAREALFHFLGSEVDRKALDQSGLPSGQASCCRAYQTLTFTHVHRHLRDASW